MAENEKKKTEQATEAYSEPTQTSNMEYFAESC